MIVFVIIVINLGKDKIFKGRKLDKLKVGEWEIFFVWFEVIVVIRLKDINFIYLEDIIWYFLRGIVVFCYWKRSVREIFSEVEGGRIFCLNVRFIEGIFVENNLVFGLIVGFYF